MTQTAQEQREQVRKLAELLDSRFQLPFGWKIGWDGIIGFIPGLGDLVTNALSFYVVYQAAMLGCPPSVLLRMGGNILVDNVIDSLPLVGPVFDFVWKSNNRNLALMETYLADPHRTAVHSRWVVAVTLVLITAFIVGFAILTWKFVVWFLAFVRSWDTAY